MELLQLKYFKTVAECGKLKQAAEALFISPPALSASISRLEKDLGFRLFDRSNNRIVLNEQGRIFLSYVNHVFSNLESARVDMHRSMVKRSVRIQLAVCTSNLWMEMFSAYAALRPDITVSQTVLRQSYLKDVDLLSTYVFLLADKEDPNSKDLGSEVLFVDRPYVMLPVQHPLANRQDLDLRELVNEIIYLPIPGQTFNHRIRRMFNEAGLPLQYASEFSSETCRYLVGKGRGISFTTQHAPHSDSDIRYVPLRESVCWEQRLYWHKERKMSVEEESLKNFIIDFFKADRPQSGEPIVWQDSVSD